MHNIEEFVSWLHSFEQRISLDELTDRLDDDSISAELLADHIHL